MIDLLKAELLRYRWWASGCLVVNLVVLVRPATAHGSAHTDLADDAERFVGVPAALTRDVLAAGTAGGPTTIADPTALLARYIDAVEDLWAFVDRWKR